MTQPIPDLTQTGYNVSIIQKGSLFKFLGYLELIQNHLKPKSPFGFLVGVLKENPDSYSG